MNSEIAIDQADFHRVMEEMGITPAALREATAKQDRWTFNVDTELVRVAPSERHGRGLFAKKDIPALAVIIEARQNGKFTPAGELANHAYYPTAFMSVSNDGLSAEFVALSDIPAGEEITVNYERVRYAMGSIPERSIRRDIHEPSE